MLCWIRCTNGGFRLNKMERDSLSCVNSRNGRLEFAKHHELGHH